jgi:transposase
MNLDLLSVILPEDLLLYFDIVNFKELGGISIKKDCLHIYLEEKNTLPKGYSKTDYQSKGFSSSKQVQDFPIRGKAVYLHLKTRRWRDKKTKSKQIRNDYSFIAEGSKLTVELSAFLKDTGRYPRRYDT